MRPGRNAVILFLAGLVVGALVVGVVVVLQGDDEPPPPDHASSAYAFVQAWERSRQGTFVVLSEFHRETEAGGDLDSPVELVQRPPDYLRRQFGSVEGRLDGWFRDQVLLEQKFVRDEKQSIEQLLGGATLVRFVQVVVGG